MTDRAFPVLLQPKVTRRPTTRQGIGHPKRTSLFEVQLPGRIIRIGIALDFDVTANGRVAGLNQVDGANTIVGIRHLATEPPSTLARPHEVVRLDPCA